MHSENVAELFRYVFNNIADELIITKQRRLGVYGWIFSQAFVIGVVDLDSQLEHTRNYLLLLF
jgi:hypothetical protein